MSEQLFNRLSTLNPTSIEFEFERQRILRDAMKNPDGTMNRTLLLKQMQIDLRLEEMRKTMTPEQIAAQLLKEANEGLENVVDGFGVIRELVLGEPAIKPVQER